jgi:hypothetical protein
MFDVPLDVSAEDGEVDNAVSSSILPCGVSSARFRFLEAILSK